MGATSTRPSSEIDLFSDESVLDPYENYRQLRDVAPAVYLTATDAWAISRFDDVREVLRDWERFTSAKGVALNDPMNEANVGGIIASDPPLHTKLRRVLAERLSPKAIDALTDRINQEADELVTAVIAKGSFDGVQDLAGIFPIQVVADLIGLPDEGRDRLLEWANAVFDAFGPDNERSATGLPLVGEMWQYVGEVATRDRLAPGSMGLAVYEAADRGEIEPESCIMLMGGYVAAGMDTTINAIGTGLQLLATHPEQWQALKSDPGLVRSAGNEILRYESPVQVFARTATADQEVSGQLVPEGERVLVLYGSANRDERKYEDPDRFDVTRNPIDHVGLGHGIHRCAGAALARLEIEAILSSLINRVEEIRLEGEPVRQPNNTVRGLRNLPLSVTVS
ncbi:MAG TPA: cytochrome P450 [Solirubrobacterales bacterium]|nr:cytochrome P450 [Solirubrobacterales bacterium]